MSKKKSSSRKTDPFAWIKLHPILSGVIAALIAIASISAAYAYFRSHENNNWSNVKQPNIVLIMTDDLDFKLIDYMPNTKKLIIGEGVSFDNYIDNIALCCPARVSLLRGQYAHNTGITGNTQPSGGFEKFHLSGQENATVATWLEDAGYRTGYMGKYMNEYPRASKNGPFAGTSSDTYIPPGWNDWFVPVGGSPYKQQNYTVNDNGKLVRFGDKPRDYMDDVISRKAAKFIQEHSDKPYFLMLSSYAPHGPYPNAARYDNKFSDVTYPKTPAFNEDDVDDKPLPISNAEQFDQGKVNELDKNFRLRVRSVQAVDDMVGSVYKTLKDTGELDNTYILFTSDNGYHMGEHRLGVGKHSPYEEDIRIPLYIRGPGIKAGSKTDILTGNIDIAPTLAELANAKAPTFIDGASLKPYLDNAQPDRNWRTAYLLQRGALDENTHDARGINEPPDSSNPADNPKRLQPFSGVRSKSHVYIEYGNGQQELYDLKNDPYQLDNLLAGGEDGLGQPQKQLLHELRDSLAKLKKCTTTACR